MNKALTVPSTADEDSQPSNIALIYHEILKTMTITNARQPRMGITIFMMSTQQIFIF